MARSTLPIIKPEQAHAKKYSLSSTGRLIECPVSPFLSKDYPQREAGRSAKQGTITHVACDMAVAAKLSGKKPNYLKADVEFVPDQIERAEAYADYVYEHVKDYMQFPHAYFIEQRFAISKEKDAWGTADCVFVYKNTSYSEPTRHIHLFDYKDGVQYVDVENNWQLAAYAYAVLKTLSKEDDGFHDFHTVTMHIFQPRTKEVEEGKEEAGTWRRYTVAELQKKAFPAIDAAINASEYWFEQGYVGEQDLAFFQRAGKWCQWCPVKDHGDCAAYRERYAKPAIETFKKRLAKFRTDEERNDPQLLTGGGSRLTPEEISFIILNKAKIKKFVDAVEKGAVQYMLRGEAIPGLKLISQNPRRSWDDNTREIAKALEKKGIENPLHWEPKLMRLSDAEKALGEDLSEFTKTAKEVSYKVVKDSHKAPALALPETDKEKFQKRLKKPKKMASNFDLDAV